MGLLQVESKRKNNRLAVYNGRLPVDDELIFGHDHIGKYMFISLDCIDIKSESAGKVS